MKYLYTYLFIINAIGFIVMIADKHFSRNNHHRIPEINLLLVAIVGGSIGTLIGMYTIRHKTRHKLFTIGVPVILAVQLLAAAYVML